MFGSEVVGASFRLIWRVLSITVGGVFSWLMPPERKAITSDVILITGGGRGIGRCLAHEFAKHHPKHIILWGRTEESLSRTVKEVRDVGINCSFMICDVSSREQIYSAAREVEAKFGNVTMLVNNAGVVFPKSVLDDELHHTEITIRTNAMAHFWTIRAFLPSMLEHNHGHIVAINSMLGLTSLNGATDYCCSKFASAGLSEALHDELSRMGASGVKVTTVYPYHVDNTMFQGIATRFPQLFPPIKEDYLGEKIVDAVLRDRMKLLVPKMMYAVAWFYRIAPESSVTSIMKFLQVDKTMDQFHQHHVSSHG